MPSTIDTRIKDTIHSFVAELDQLVRRNTLAELRTVLDDTRPARRGPGRPAVAARPRSATLVESVAPAIVAHLKANDGQTVGEIVKAVGAAPEAAKVAIAELLASGRIQKTGKRRATRYHLASVRPGPIAKARPAKRARHTLTKAKVVYDQARQDLLASL